MNKKKSNIKVSSTTRSVRASETGQIRKAVEKLYNQEAKDIDRFSRFATVLTEDSKPKR